MCAIFTRQQYDGTTSDAFDWVKSVAAPPLLSAALSPRMYLLIGFRKSTPPQNRGLILYYY